MTSSSWRPAARKLVEIVEGTPLATKGLGLGDKLVHEPRMTFDQLAPSRRFLLEVTAGRVLWPDEPGPFRHAKDFTLGFAYSARAAWFDLMIAIGEDMEAVSRRLLDPELHDEANTGIVALSLGGGEALPYTVARVDADTVLVTLTGSLEHHDLA